MINDFAVARALHVLALVHWIGGVAMVTTIVLPRARALADPHAALTAFEAFEGPFAVQARFSILLAGLSGFYMLNKLQAWTLTDYFNHKAIILKRTVLETHPRCF